MQLAPIIPSCITDRPADSAGIARSAAQYATRPALRARSAWSGSGTTRELTVQVHNQKLQTCEGYFMVSVVLGTDGTTADPSYTVSTGTELDEFTVALGGLFITGSAGALVLSVTQASWVDLIPRVAAICPFDGESVGGSGDIPGVWTPVDVGTLPPGDPSEYMFDDETNSMLLLTM